jgi:hypothetical protein
MLTMTVLASTDSFPGRYPDWISRRSELRVIAQVYIGLAADLVDDIRDEQDFAFLGHRVLGIHFRGKEMRVAPRRPLPPTCDQMSEVTKPAVRDYNFDPIFVISKDSAFFCDS